ncbi:MAG: D-alanyl-D-alanine carboxypeptidase, partial [Myxococcota bacterium]
MWFAIVLACRGPSIDAREPLPLAPGHPGGDPGSTPPGSTPPGSTPPGSTTTTTTPPAASTVTTPEGDPYAVAPTLPDLDPGALDAIAADIDAIIDSTVASTAVYVKDADNGQVVYAHDEDVPMTPASNTKLFTTGAAFDQLGEDHRLELTAWADAAPDAAGAVDELTVVSEHDFTWSTFFYTSSSFPADRLADQLYDAGLRRVDGTLTLAGEVEVEGYQFGYYDADYYRDAGSVVLLDALESRGISVGSLDTTSSFAAPAGAIELTRRGSAPLSVACHPLNVYSHNEFADILSHHEGWVLRGSSTYTDGAASVTDWLDGAGIDTAGLELHDGSGLSHDNTVTTRQIVEMQAYLYDRPAGIAWQRTFSTAGVLGTLGSRMTGPSTYGRFLGKTGTLTGVIATSGVLYHATDGHRYLISVLMNDVVDDTYARGLEDDVVEAIASDRRGVGVRPAAPVLREVRSRGDGTLSITWDGVSGADGYLVWLSTDGLVWRRSDARYVTATAFVAGGLAQDATAYVRVSASSRGGESDPSDAYGARVGHDPSSVLIVDGNDRWATQWENPMGRGHDFGVVHADALGARSFDTVANEAVADGTIALTDYAAVVWMFGEESSTEETFDDVEQVLVGDALAAGTALFVSGAEIGWDLDELGSATDQAFFRDVVHAGYLADDAEKLPPNAKVASLAIQPASI